MADVPRTHEQHHARATMLDMKYIRRYGMYGNTERLIDAVGLGVMSKKAASRRRSVMSIKPKNATWLDLPER